MNPNRGFTLIEILVVLVILGVTITFIALGFERLEQDRVTSKAAKLSSWLQNMSDTAVLNGGLYGAVIHSDVIKRNGVTSDAKKIRLEAISFYNYRWFGLKGDDLDQLNLAENTVLSIYRSKRWQPWISLDVSENYAVPDVVFFPNGTVQPDRFRLSIGNDTASVERDKNGLFVWRVVQTL